MYDPSLSVFDFKVRFLNDIAQPALNNGTTITVLSEDVEFNGVPDLQEMVGVSGLAASNVTSMYGNNSMGSDAPSYVNTSSINLVWDSINSFSSYPQNVVDATGVSHTLTEEQANRAGTYNIYMFIASGTDNPSSEFPGVSSTEGT
ncbi:hypothetical protein H8D85_00980 [bacterium]|nr:hypothetical protein [bacterium]